MSVEPDRCVVRAVGRAQAGLTLPEMMIGIVVAMLVGLAAISSVVAQLATQRQAASATATGGDAATLVALLRKDISMAGLGFVDAENTRCATLNLSVDGRMLSNSQRFSPIRYWRVGVPGGERWHLDVAYATSVEATAEARLAVPTTGATAELRSRVGDVDLGDTVLLFRGDGGAECLVRSVTGQTPPATGGVSPVPGLQFDGGHPEGRHNRLAFASGAVSFGEDDRLARLHRMTWRRYTLDEQRQLVLEDRIAGTSTVMARGVLTLRVQYGLATDAGSRDIAEWRDAGPGITASWDPAALPVDEQARIRAVRVGVVVRSPQREKVDRVTRTCTTTTVNPTLFDATVPIPAVWRAEWQCFRYRAAEMLVPLRNSLP